MPPRTRPVTASPALTAHPSGRPRRRRAAGLAVGGVLALTACSGPTVSVEAAPDAADPACAPAMVALPDEIGGNERRETDSQATAAWGEPSAVVLRCGVEVPGPTTDQCVSVDGVDWVVRDESDHWRITAYGRTPAVEAVFTKTDVSSDTVLTALGSAVRQIPATRHCLGAEDAAAVG